MLIKLIHIEDASHPKFKKTFRYYCGTIGREYESDESNRRYVEEYDLKAKESKKQQKNREI